jgi:glycosyltransferase involved in cell wall biosynthesis
MQGNRMPPSVTIVITNFNYGRFLRPAIDSALEQDYGDVEVIVVDDGSVDDSRDIMASYGDAFVAVYKGNGGQASAFNAGFVRSTGEVIIFLDADDVLLPNTATRVADAFAEDTTLAKVMYPMEIIDAAGARTGTVKPFEHLPRRSGNLRHSSLWYPFDTVWMATSGNAFATKKISQVFPVPEPDYRVCADWYLALLTPLLGDVRFLHEVGALHRIHGGNSFERSPEGTDLDQLRATIIYSRTTARHIVDTAERLGIASRPKSADDVIAVSDIIKRIVSRKADKVGHPISSDTLPRLVFLGGKAALRRTDVSPLMRLLYAAWLFVIVSVPRRTALKLSPLFSYPERRRSLNAFLGMLHR